MKERVQISEDCNYDYYESNSKFLVSFPYKKIETQCPSEYDVEIVFDDEPNLCFEKSLGVWRSVPEYLGRGLGGHLVLIMDCQKDIRPLWKKIKAIDFESKSKPITDHELCNWRYLLS